MVQFSIITACKNRLDHLKQSLPAMLGQADAEVIVVDFSCPEGTGAYVRANFAQARVVEIKDKSYFNNWEARNAGAAQALGQWLVFVDADVLLAPDCTATLAPLLKPSMFGTLDPKSVSTSSGLGSNDLFGFQVIRRSDFEQVKGFDDLLTGWGAGGDVDILFSLQALGVEKAFLPASILAGNIAHGDELRFKHTGGDFRKTFMQNLIYREMKKSLIKLIGFERFYDGRQTIYACAKTSAEQFHATGNPAPAQTEIEFSARRVPLGASLGFPGMRIHAAVKITVDGGPKPIK
jgi:glycosyltransferase involved in cell wall biosynthesis